MKIVLPIAGRGSRFLEASDRNPDYKLPKPLIPVQGKPMILWALESLPFLNLPSRPANTDFKVLPKDLVFIARQDHQDEFDIGDQLKRHISPEINFIFLDQITRGAAETVLKAKKYINSADDIMVLDSDLHLDGTPLYQKIISKSSDTQGIIAVSPPPDQEIKYSYTLFDQDERALEVGEKDPVLAAKGAYANVGCYYFSHGDVFISEVEQMIEEGDMYGSEGKKEFYIAPIYQRLLRKNLKIEVAQIDKLWSLGTPKDLEAFLVEFPKP